MNKNIVHLIDDAFWPSFGEAEEAGPPLALGGAWRHPQACDHRLSRFCCWFLSPVINDVIGLISAMNSNPNHQFCFEVIAVIKKITEVIVI